MRSVSFWTVLDWWRTRAYLLREGEYCQQIEVLAPTRKARKRLNLPAIKPLKAQRAHVLNHVEEFKKRTAR